MSIDNIIQRSGEANNFKSSPYKMIQDYGSADINDAMTILEVGHIDNPFLGGKCVWLKGAKASRKFKWRVGKKYENPNPKGFHFQKYEATEDFKEEIDGELIQIKKGAVIDFAIPY